MKRRVRGRVAFRARRQITKTKPSIREETGGPAHSIALRGVHTHVPSRARAHNGVCACVRTRVLAAGFTVCEPGSLRSRLRFGVTRPRSKRKRRLGFSSSMWAGRGPAQRANDLHALEISLTIGPEAKQGWEKGGEGGSFLDDTWARDRGWWNGGGRIGI